jgi:hypothetical protein
VGKVRSCDLVMYTPRPEGVDLVRYTKAVGFRGDRVVGPYVKGCETIRMVIELVATTNASRWSSRHQMQSYCLGCRLEGYVDSR